MILKSQSPPQTLFDNIKLMGIICQVAGPFSPFLFEVKETEFKN